MEKIAREIFDRLIEKEKEYQSTDNLNNFRFETNCFLEEDEDFKMLLNIVNENKQYFDKKFIDVFKNELLNRLELINENIKTINDEKSRENKKKFHSFEIEEINKQLGFSSLSDYISNYSFCFINDDINSMLSEQYPKIMNDKDYIKEYEPLYRIVEILYNNYKESITPFINFKKLEDIKEELFEIYYPDNYVNKYNLLRFSNFHNLVVSYQTPSYICDSQKQRYFYNQYIPAAIFEVIKDLLDNQYIQDLSFLITDISNQSIIAEEKEYGRMFSYNIKELPSISCFYDENSIDNKLVIKKQVEGSKTSLTFETLKSDFLYQDNQVITNLIHIEIENIDNEDFITHLDHEFIIYEYDKYVMKANNYLTKGCKKVKTFKIDNSKIPLKYNLKNTPVLVCFVMELLDNQELIKEYFSKIN